jgi:hypothetical protein
MLHNSLKVIPAFGSHPDFIALNGRLNLDREVLDDLHDLLGFLLGNALRQHYLLAKTAVKSLLWCLELKGLLGNFTTREPRPENVLQVPQFHIIISEDLDFLFILEKFHGAFASFEIKAGRKLFFGLVYGIINFLEIDLGNNIKRRLLGPWGKAFQDFFVGGVMKACSRLRENSSISRNSRPVSKFFFEDLRSWLGITQTLRPVHWTGGSPSFSSRMILQRSNRSMGSGSITETPPIPTSSVLATKDFCLPAGWI